MLVSGKTGPLLYMCLIVQIYYFSIVINHRRDSQPGATFTLHCFFLYFTAQQYFYRGNHRERINAIQFGKVCPGQVYCGEIYHWALIFFELLAPYIVCLLLLPIIVRARVGHAYANTKKNDDEIKSKPSKKTESKNLVADVKINESLAEKFPVSFTGDMVRGMAYLQLNSVVLLACSGIYVYWNYNTVIFPDRAAPKYIFDMFVCFVYMLFAMFWQ